MLLEKEGLPSELFVNCEGFTMRRGKLKGLSLMVNLAQFFPPAVDAWVVDSNDRSTWKYLNFGFKAFGLL